MITMDTAVFTVGIKIPAQILLKLVAHVDVRVCALLVRQRTTPGSAPRETSRTLVKILGDQCMHVQNQCYVTNRL